MSGIIYSLGIVGTGNMAEAFIKGILGSSIINSSFITAFEKKEARAEHIKSKYGVLFQPTLKDLVKKSRYIFIAVKPQDVPGVISEMGPYVDAGNNTIISIAAGVPTDFYETRLGKNIAVIRIMPNTPALLKKGMSAISCGRFVKEPELEFVKEIIGTTGDYVIVDEKLQNAITAISGSGPAYFFKFCKCLMDSALKMGIDRQTAAALVTNTAAGAICMLKEHEYDADGLIKMVASPGGTTEAAMAVFENENIDKIIEKAVKHAQKKAVKIQELLYLKN